MQLKNKCILLTGATGGIGKHLALQLAAKGAKLILVGRDEHKLNSLAQQIHAKHGTANTLIADFDNADSTQSLAQQALQQFGQVDILINNAGILDFIQFEDQSAERIAHMINTNVTAPILLTQALFPHFKTHSHAQIVMIGSILGSIGFPHYATYCASKFALHGFSQALRRELVDTNIGVTYIAPRGVNTPMNDAATLAMLAKTGGNIDEPEKVAAIIVKAIEHQKQEVFIGQPESLVAWLNGVMPSLVSLGLKKQARTAKEFIAKK